MSTNATHLHLVRDQDRRAPHDLPQANVRSLLHAADTGPGDLLFAAKPDLLSITDATIIARMLARYQPDDGGINQLLAEAREKAHATQQYLDFFTIADPAAYDPYRFWGKASGRDRIRIPLGLTAAGTPFVLDFKEAAEGGKGPHGSVVAITGGGKSEFLRALVLTMMIWHSPDEVQFILGDFKGASTWTPFEEAPHVHGVVSNLEESEHLLTRFVDAVMGRLKQRQEILKEHKIKDARVWNARRNRDIARTGKSDLPPMPVIFTIMDEMSEATAQRPELIPMFASYNKLGRSLWMHALYASQFADSGRLSELENNLTYRVAGKVANATASREALGFGPNSDRAYTDLKNAPAGEMIINVDGELSRFRSFFVSGDYVPPDPAARHGAERIENAVEPHRFTTAVAALPKPEPVAEPQPAEPGAEQQHDDEPDERPEVCQVIVGQMVKAHPKHFDNPLWLPPLDDTPALGIDALYERHLGEPWTPTGDRDGHLAVPIALVDEASKAAQYPQVLDLAGAGGHVAVVGAPHTGRSTSLQTLAMALAMNHSPERVQIYGLDLGGPGLAGLAGLPHIGLVTASDKDRMRRIFDIVTSIHDRRRRSFEQLNNETNQQFTMKEFRDRKFHGAPGPLPENDYFGDVFLFIDGITALAKQHEDLHAKLVILIQDCLSYGIHIAISNDKWTNIHHEIKSKVNSRLELRFAERGESEMTPKGVTRPEDFTVPALPGRGLKAGGLHTLTAIPHPVDSTLEDHVAVVAAQWAGHKPAQTPRMLPTKILLGDLPQTPGKVLIGVGENQPQVHLDFTKSNHLIVAGDGSSGKTTTLRTIAHSIKAGFPDATIVTIDPQRDLEDVQDLPGGVIYATKPTEINDTLKALAEKCQELTVNYNRERKATGTRSREFTGRRMFILIDDLHVVTMPSLGGVQPWAPLVPSIQSASDIGVHIIVSLTTRGWTRHSNNPFVDGLNRAHTGLILLDANKEDGQIMYGHKATAQNVPGRGLLAYRKGYEFIQVADTESGAHK